MLDKWFFYTSFCFQIIVDSKAIVEEITYRSPFPFTQCYLVLSVCITTVQNWSQKDWTGATHRLYSECTKITYTRDGVFLIPCNFVYSPVYDIITVIINVKISINQSFWLFRINTKVWKSWIWSSENYSGFSWILLNFFLDFLNPFTHSLVYLWATIVHAFSSILKE